MTDQANPIVALAAAVSASGEALQGAIKARIDAKAVYDDTVMKAKQDFEARLAQADADFLVFTDAETKARNTFHANYSALNTLVSDLDDDNGLELTVIEGAPEDIPVPGMTYEDAPPAADEPAPANDLVEDPAPVEEVALDPPAPAQEEAAPAPAAEQAVETSTDQPVATAETVN